MNLIFTLIIILSTINATCIPVTRDALYPATVLYGLVLFVSIWGLCST